MYCYDKSLQIMLHFDLGQESQDFFLLMPGFLGENNPTDFLYCCAPGTEDDSVVLAVAKKSQMVPKFCSASINMQWL